MRAITCRKYGGTDQFRLEEVEKPATGDDEVLVKVCAASINSADVRLLTANPFLVRLSMGFSKPKYPIFGADVAGRVEAVGSNITKFQPGDEVYGDLLRYRLGGFAEYTVGPEALLARKPVNLTFVEAAAVPIAAITALQALRDGAKVQPRQKVLIYGASGGVGTFAVQIAKTLGAEVTAVCSTRNVELVRSLGADVVVDYKKDDFARNGTQYDLILGINGHRSIGDYKRALTQTGRYIMVGGSNAQLFEGLLWAPIRSLGGSRKMGSLSVDGIAVALDSLRVLLEAGAIAPVIDCTYPLAQVADAFRYMIDEHARGKVVITVED